MNKLLIYMHPSQYKRLKNQGSWDDVKQRHAKRRKIKLKRSHQ